MAITKLCVLTLLKNPIKTKRTQPTYSMFCQEKQHLNSSLKTLGQNWQHQPYTAGRLLLAKVTL